MACSRCSRSPLPASDGPLQFNTVVSHADTAAALPAPALPAPMETDEVEEIVDGADVTTGAAADAGLREVALRRVLALRASACADRDEWRAVVVDAAEARFPIEPYVVRGHRVDALLADAQALRAAVLSAAGGDSAVELYYEVADGDVLHAEVVPRADGAPGEARLMADWTLRTRGLARATGAGRELALPGMLTATFATRGARRCGASGGGAHAPRVQGLSFAFDAREFERELRSVGLAAPRVAPARAQQSSSTRARRADREKRRRREVPREDEREKEGRGGHPVMIRPPQQGGDVAW